MCKINDEIKKTQGDMNTEVLKLLSDQIVKLSDETKQAIRDVKMDLTDHIDREISHLNGNIKNSQQYANMKFEEIEKSMDKICELANERNSILTKDIEKANHGNGCPNDLDKEFEKLKESLGPIISIAKYRILQIMLFITALVILLSAYNTFSSIGDKQKQQIENITKRVIK